MCMFVQVVTVGPGTPSRLLLLHHPHCPGPGEYLLCGVSGWSPPLSWQGPRESTKRPCLRTWGEAGAFLPPPSRTADTGVPCVTIGVFLKSVQMKALLCSPPPPWHAPSWTRGSPAEIKTSSLSSPKFLVKS